MVFYALESFSFKYTISPRVLAWWLVFGLKIGLVVCYFTEDDSQGGAVYPTWTRFVPANVGGAGVEAAGG